MWDLCRSRKMTTRRGAIREESRVGGHLRLVAGGNEIPSRHSRFGGNRVDRSIFNTDSEGGNGGEHPLRGGNHSWCVSWSDVFWQFAFQVLDADCKAYIYIYIYIYIYASGSQLVGEYRALHRSVTSFVARVLLILYLSASRISVINLVSHT